MLQHINDLTEQYKLDKTPPKKPVLSCDDLHVVLFFHWVCCKRVYPDEEHRLSLSLLFLFAAYTGARPVSLVDASVKLPDKDARSAARDATIRFYDPNEEDGTDEDSDEIPDFDTEELPSEEEIMSVLFEHVTILLLRVGDRVELEPAMFVTLIHTKGENKKPQPYVLKIFSLFLN
jgi:hypothetical protein